MKSDGTMASVFYATMLVAGFVVITGGMMHARVVLIPLMMAIFIAIISNGPISWLQEKGCSRWLSILLFCLITLGVLALSVLIIGTSMKDFLHNLPEYEKNLRQQLQPVHSFLAGKGLDVGGKAGGGIFGPASVMKYVGLFINEIGNLMANGFVIFFLVVFMLNERTVLPAKLKSIYGDDDRRTNQIKKFHESVKHYMSIKLLVSLATGLLATLSLLVIGVDYPVMWGMVAFAFNFVPNIGSIIAAIPPTLLALVTAGPGSSVAVACCYVVINMVMGNIVEPRVMGKGLGLSTLVVFLSLVFWGWVLGPVGMLLSVILTMKLKILLDSNADTRWLGILLGSDAPDDTAQGQA